MHYFTILSLLYRQTLYSVDVSSTRNWNFSGQKWCSLNFEKSSKYVKNLAKNVNKKSPGSTCLTSFETRNSFFEHTWSLTNRHKHFPLLLIWESTHHTLRLSLYNMHILMGWVKNSVGSNLVWSLGLKFDFQVQSSGLK